MSGKVPDYGNLLEENRQLKEQLHLYRDYDLLTGLYNKNEFYLRVGQRLRERADGNYQILLVDVERFKLVNDLYGPQEGDRLLKYLAKGLETELASEQSLFSRVGSDVFALFMAEEEGGEDAVERILRLFSNCPLDMEIIPAIGIYPIDDKTLPVSLMCDRAAMAMRSVKGDYAKHAAVYDKSMRKSLVEEHEILNRMEGALARREFQIYMQPRCNMYTGKIVGAEALVRWAHPEKGIIAPGSFIPIFEKNGFIKKLDQYVWEETAAWLHRWILAGHQPIPISVNVSRMDIFSLDVCGIMNRLIRQYDLRPELLQLEITESAYTNRSDEIIGMVNRLMRDGFTVLMDDFGSGYSSLNILKDISVNVLKLDMRFLDREDQKSRDILESVLHMAKWLNLKVVAEGVESKHQADFLMRIGCIYAQGFLYYKPMPVEAFERLIEDERQVEYSETDTAPGKEKLVQFRDLFNEDMVSGEMLSHILGAVALYSFNGSVLKVLYRNEQYVKAMYTYEGEPANVLDYVLKEDRQALFEAVSEVREAENEGREVTVRLRLETGRLRWLRLRLFFLSVVNEENILYASLFDMTDYMEAMDRLATSEQSLRIAMEATINTLFELDIPTRTARYAPHSRDAFGLSDCVADAPEGFIEQGSVCRGYEKPFCDMYQAIYDGEDKASCVIRAHMGDGNDVWNRITLTAVKDKHGKNVKAVGLVENVTKERELEILTNKMGLSKP